ncbi:MAG TPA: hypothetical protein VH138_18615 [Vicinamibacterales bacterium]|jgi:hypothetical protein|nr:hypothetical protein [Vicinamibacterales bacterium]
MHRRSLVAVLVLVLSLAAGRAEAVTVRDVIELSKAGLSDSVLLALIDVDRSVFAIDAGTLKQLKSAGVSDAVIVAMIKSGREARVEDAPPPFAQEPAPMPEAPESAPQPAAPPPVPYPVAVAVPIYIAVPIAAPTAALKSGDGHRAMKQTAPVDAAPNCQSAQVPNWGFGGNVRQLPPACR